MNNEKEEAKLIKRIEMFEIFNKKDLSFLYDNKMYTSQELYDAIIEKYGDQKEDIEDEDIEDEDIEDEDIEDEVQLYMKIQKKREDYIDLVEDDVTYKELIDNLLKEDVSDINQAKKLVSFLYLYEKDVLNQYIIDLIRKNNNTDVIKQLKNKCKEINPDYRENIKNYINNECIIIVSYTLEDNYYYDKNKYVMFEMFNKRRLISFPNHTASYRELSKIGQNLSRIKSKDFLETYTNIVILLFIINLEYNTKIDKISKEKLISSVVSVCKQDINTNYNKLSWDRYYIENAIEGVYTFLEYIDYNRSDSKIIFENIKMYIQNQQIKNLVGYLITTFKDKEKNIIDLTVNQFISRIIRSKNFDFLKDYGKDIVNECDKYINKSFDFQRGKQEL